MSRRGLRNAAHTLNATPQNKPLAGQKANNAGGYSYEVDDLMCLRRFLILGAEGGTFYVKEQKLVQENAGALARLVAAGRGVEAVALVEKVSVEGLAFRTDTTIFALALLARQASDVAAKRAAYAALGKVARIPTHLFAFVDFAEAASEGGTGWGRAQRSAVAHWYTARPARALATAVTKYTQRGGWSHRDVLRLCHAKAADEATAVVLTYAVKGWPGVVASLGDDSVEAALGRGGDRSRVLEFLLNVETAKCLAPGAADAARMAALIREAGLVREHVPTVHLNSVVVWEALLEQMPLTALVRNLGKMSALGMFEQAKGPAVRAVESKLGSAEQLQRARVHPFALLLALVTYRRGRGDKGKLEWPVSARVAAALDRAFYASFKNVRATGKRWMLALDVSGSMGTPVMGSSVITARDASAAMAMVAVNTEEHVDVVAFHTGLMDIGDKVRRGVQLDTVVRNISGLPFGGTDCALPMLHALQRRKKVDVFVVYTDSETWFGDVHPSEALRRYRARMSIPDAKLIVVGMASNGFSIADPKDPNMLDVVGFDASAPQVMQAFVEGTI